MPDLPPRDRPHTPLLHRFNWRAVFFLALWMLCLYVGWLLGNHWPPRPAGEKTLLVGGWIGIIALYGGLVWRARGISAHWAPCDVTILLMMAFAAVHAASWPAFWIWTRPASLGGIIAASALGACIGTYSSRNDSRPDAPA